MKQLKNKNGDNQTDLQQKKLRGCFGCPHLNKVHEIETRASSAPWNRNIIVRIDCLAFKDGKGKNAPGAILLKPKAVSAFTECVHWVRETARLQKVKVIKRQVRLKQIESRTIA